MTDDVGERPDDPPTHEDGDPGETPADSGGSESPADSGASESPADSGASESPADSGGSESPADSGASGSPADTDEGPTPTRRTDPYGEQPETPREWIHWFRTVESGPAMVAREVVSSVGFVVAIGLLLFAISGVWPPMVAVQSGSMEPHMHRGDLVFIVEENRFAGKPAVEGTGVVTAAAAGNPGYRKFGGPGDVIVYRPDGSDRPDPIIHRARFYVEDGENWYDEADPQYVTAGSCEQLPNCPAPNSGFITKGDDNAAYDQAQGMSRPVKPAWIKGKAMVRVPWLGLIRLKFGALTRGAASAVGVAVVTGGLVGRD